MGILYRIKVAKVRQITASQDRKGTLKLDVLLGRMEKYVNETLVWRQFQSLNILFNPLYKRRNLADNVHYHGGNFLYRLKLLLE